MDLSELYQDIIIDHNRNPRNFRAIEQADKVVDGYNPLCGDKLRLYLKLDGERIADVSFMGSGCAISTASASLMTEYLRGKSVAEADAVFQQMHALLTGGAADPDQLGKLAALSGVQQYPSRVKCASLCWHTLHAALAGKQEPVTTE